MEACPKDGNLLSHLLGQSFIILEIGQYVKVCLTSGARWSLAGEKAFFPFTNFMTRNDNLRALRGKLRGFIKCWWQFFLAKTWNFPWPKPIDFRHIFSTAPKLRSMWMPRCSTRSLLDRTGPALGTWEPGNGHESQGAPVGSNPLVGRDVFPFLIGWTSKMGEGSQP